MELYNPNSGMIPDQQQGIMPSKKEIEALKVGDFVKIGIYSGYGVTFIFANIHKIENGTFTGCAWDGIEGIIDKGAFFEFGADNIFYIC